MHRFQTDLCVIMIVKFLEKLRRTIPTDFGAWKSEVTSTQDVRKDKRNVY